MLKNTPSHRLSLLTTVIFIEIFVSACDAQTGSGSIIGPTPTQISGTPTATPLPMISLKSPVLGGSWQALDNLFGSNGCPPGYMYQFKVGTACVDVKWPDETTSRPDDSNTRITGIDVSPDTKWNIAQEQQALAQFLPPDAKYVGTKTVYDPTTLAVGIEKTYTSVLLANALPKADFTAANGKQAKPGTFYMYLDYGYGDIENNALGTDEDYVQMAY